MSIEENRTAIPDLHAETLPAVAAARQLRWPAWIRSRRLPQISALAATVVAGVAGVTGMTNFSASASTTSGDLQPSVTSTAGGRAAAAYKKVAHTASPQPCAARARTLKPPAAHPAPGKGYPHAISRPSPIHRRVRLGWSRPCRRPLPGGKMSSWRVRRAVRLANGESDPGM